jgi:hypothetical protein
LKNYSFAFVATIGNISSLLTVISALESDLWMAQKLKAFKAPGKIIKAENLWSKGALKQKQL